MVVGRVPSPDQPAASPRLPPRQVSLYGLVTIQAFYLPFAFLFVTVIMGGSPVPDLFGIAAGHLWYFFTDLYPRSSGRRAGLLHGGGGQPAACRGAAGCMQGAVYPPVPRWPRHVHRRRLDAGSHGARRPALTRPFAAAPQAAAQGARVPAGVARRHGRRPRAQRGGAAGAERVPGARAAAGGVVRPRVLKGSRFGAADGTL